MTLQEIARHYYEWLLANGFDKAVAWNKGMELLKSGAKKK